MRLCYASYDDFFAHFTLLCFFGILKCLFCVVFSYKYFNFCNAIFYIKGNERGESQNYLFEAKIDQFLLFSLFFLVFL